MEIREYIGFIMVFSKEIVELIMINMDFLGGKCRNTLDPMWVSLRATMGIKMIYYGFPAGKYGNNSDLLWAF